MLTEEEFDRIQRLLCDTMYGSGAYDKLSVPTSKSRDFDLKGLLRCGECGCCVVAEEKERKLANGQTHKYIYCVGYTNI